jgi:hypothetical protein
MNEEINAFVSAWTEDPLRVKPAFLALWRELEGLAARTPDAELVFVARPGATYSLRARRASAGARPVFALVDVVDESDGRFLSVCFYADAVSDPDELGQLVPLGLLGEDGYCFDLEAPEQRVLDYLADRFSEAANA